MRNPLNVALWQGRNQTSAQRAVGCAAASRTEGPCPRPARAAGSPEVTWEKQLCFGRWFCSLLLPLQARVRGCDSGLKPGRLPRVSLRWDMRATCSCPNTNLCSKVIFLRVV